MIRLALVMSAALLSSTAAFADDVYDFKIGGQSIHIEQPRNCNSPSCATISIPGIYESGPKRKRARTLDDSASVAPDKKGADIKPAPAEQTPSIPPPAPPPSAATAPESLEPANGAPVDAKAAPVPPASAPSGLAAPSVAALSPLPGSAAVAGPAATSPVGVWLTEEKEGKVRIEDCGGSLCGYAIDAKTNANGDKVLINMKAGKDKWSGKIHDPKSGSDYDSTIALKGSDRLRVQGCAFGGMFCGGQTWTRVN